MTHLDPLTTLSTHPCEIFPLPMLNTPNGRNLKIIGSSCFIFESLYLGNKQLPPNSNNNKNNNNKTLLWVRQCHFCDLCNPHRILIIISTSQIRSLGLIYPIIQQSLLHSFLLDEESARSTIYAQMHNQAWS